MQYENNTISQGQVKYCNGKYFSKKEGLKLNFQTFM